jgi:hypothetical protein
MKSQVVGLRVASAIFGLVCLCHVLRLVLGFQILIGSHLFSRGLSLIAVVITGLLSYWLGKLACPRTQPPPP